MRYLEERNIDREEARAEGKAEGLVEGITKQLISDIKGMLEVGLSPDTISRIVKRTPEEVQDLIKQIEETEAADDSAAEE